MQDYSPKQGAAPAGADGARDDSPEQNVFDAFMFVMKEKRDEAIRSKHNSGIEQEWREDDEFYEGIDDANRKNYGMKPKTLEGAFEHREMNESNTRSTIFLNITRPYCDAASARVGDMLLPTDDRNWGLRPTPVPELVRQLEDYTPLLDPKTGQAPQVPQVDPATGEQMMQPPPSGPDGQPMVDESGQPMQPQPATRDMTVADMAEQEIEAAKASAERAQQEIDDYHTECQYHSEVRQVIDDAARIGVGILKGPFPIKVKGRAVRKQQDGTWKMEVKEDVRPASKRIDPRNFFPHGACGENIHNGSYVFERDEITTRQLMDLIGVDGYLEEQIMRVLEEGPIDSRTGTRTLKEGQRLTEKDLFEIWYFHGMVCKKDLVAAGMEFEEDDYEGKYSGDYKEYPAIITMVNDRIIKAAMSPLDTGEFPYDVMIWQKRTGHWAGIGVSRQMRYCQRGLNAAVRNMMDNAGLSAGPQIVVDRTKVVPADGQWKITPRKLWWTSPDAELANVKDAFMSIPILSMQAELMAIIEFFMKRAEDITGLPMLIQGQLGAAPDTVGGMNMLQNNASAVLRRIARTFDDRITEPHIGRYYEWVLLYGPDDAKGDYQIDARGSSALVERDAQAQALMQMVGMTLNPQFGLSPSKVMKEALKSQRFDPKRLEMDEEEKQALNQAPPPDPKLQIAEMTLQQKDRQFEAQAQLDQQRMQFEAQQKDLDRRLAQWERQLEAQLRAAELAGDQEMSIQEIKSMIAREAMKLRTQKELSFHSNNLKAAQIATPPTEPAGRAPKGQAFQR